jgi:LmbE family N-acetylglucosaminyl deacetylase
MVFRATLAMDAKVTDHIWSVQSLSDRLLLRAAARPFVSEECLNLYLSPHLDDAIFSCAGLIYVQRHAGERVGVLTLCAGLPSPGSLSPLAREYESAWGGLGAGMAVRRAEDAALLSSWGVESWECETQDAIYRADKGVPYYETRASLFRKPHPQDAASLLPFWQTRLRQLAEEEAHGLLLYAPLGVGGHVDHELARGLGERTGEGGWRVWFYEDYPYVELEAGGVRAAQARFGIHTWTSRIMPIDVRAKIDAVRAYHTQMGRVFGSEKDLARRVKGFTAETACALNPWERVRRRLAPSGLRLRLWRRVLGYHGHAERIWTWS